MKTLTDWLRELFDLTSLLVFIMIFAYILFIDVPGLERKNWRTEASLVKYLTWAGLGGFLGFVVLHFIH